MNKPNLVFVLHLLIVSVYFSGSKKKPFHIQAQSSTFHSPSCPRVVGLATCYISRLSRSCGLDLGPRIGRLVVNRGQFVGRFEMDAMNVSVLLVHPPTVFTHPNHTQTDPCFHPSVSILLIFREFRSGFTKEHRLTMQAQSTNLHSIRWPRVVGLAARYPVYSVCVV
ncbi:hypothetical protein C8J57DRAFT_250832 [Mycena rebaudengoi]|nr:hypothetical protein C8J57DRAFT_250832 [Mycena rebaudengoi]